MSSKRIPTHEEGDFNEDQALPVTQVYEDGMVTHAEFRSTIFLMAKAVTALCGQSRSAGIGSQRHKEMGRSRAKRARMDGSFQGKSVYVQYPTCKTCGKSHKGVCLAGLNACYKCAKPGHHARECRSGAPTPYSRGTGEMWEVSKEINACLNYGRKHRGKEIAHPPSMEGGGLNNRKCSKCGKEHGGVCYRETGRCFGCGQLGHRIAECPNVRNKGKGVARQGQVV